MLLAIDVGLTALQRRHFPIRQRAVLDPAFDALVLIDVARNVGLHALGRGRVRVAGHRVVLVCGDVAADFVLRRVQLRAFCIRQLTVTQILRLQVVDMTLFLLELCSFLGAQRAVLQAVLDAGLLVDVALGRARGGGLGKGAGSCH